MGDVSTKIAFTKGHGTENDFVLVPSLDGGLDLDAGVVAALCDRRAGIGGDGMIRVVPTAAAAESSVRDLADLAEWFMDYRNADGSVAEMCGNGTRVFAAYLRREGLETHDEFSIATRSGVKTVRFEGDLIAVNLGVWRLTDPESATEKGFDSLVHVPGLDPLSALSLDLGNPNTVAALPEAVDLADLDLSGPPMVHPVPSAGSNVSFVRPLAPGHLVMRAFERGVGETRSCGTAACAAALATAYWSGEAGPSTDWTVDTAGGRLRVRPLPEDEVELVGPARLVADGTYEPGPRAGSRGS